MTYSPKGRRNLLATSADEPIVVALEIFHTDLAEPIRVVNDSIDLWVEDHQFVACRFQLIRPDDVDQQVPKARLSVDNIGRELTQWLEQSNGGKGAWCRMITVLRSQSEEYAIDYFAEVYTYGEAPIIEYEMTMELTGLSIDNFAVSGDLGYQETLNQAAVAVRYDPVTAPALW